MRVTFNARVAVFFLTSLCITTLLGCTPSLDVQGLLFSNSDGLQIRVNEDTRQLVSWSSLAGLCDPVALSPNGHGLVYSRTGQDLWLTDLISGDSTELVDGAIRDHHADIMQTSWSPDGVWLAILAGQTSEGRPVPEEVSLFTLQVKEHQTVELASGVATFAWLPGDGQIVYSQQFGQGLGGIFLVNPDGEGSRLLLEGVFNPFIAVSPQGDALVVVTRLAGDDLQNTLLMLDPVSGSSVDLLSGLEIAGSSILDRPIWSPLGDQIAFSSCVPVQEGDVCSWTLFIMNPAESTIEEMALNAVGPLVWSPDGKTIAFEHGAVPRHVYRVSLQSHLVEEWFEIDRCSHLFEWR